MCQSVVEHIFRFELRWCQVCKHTLILSTWILKLFAPHAYRQMNEVSEPTCYWWYLCWKRIEVDTGFRQSSLYDIYTGFIFYQSPRNQYSGKVRSLHVCNRSEIQVSDVLFLKFFEGFISRSFARNSLFFITDFFWKY